MVLYTGFLYALSSSTALVLTATRPRTFLEKNEFFIIDTKTVLRNRNHMHAEIL